MPTVFNSTMRGPAYLRLVLPDVAPAVGAVREAHAARGARVRLVARVSALVQLQHVGARKRSPASVTHVALHSHTDRKLEFSRSLARIKQCDHGHLYNRPGKRASGPYIFNGK